MNCIKSLYDRTTECVQGEETSFSKAWKVMLPILLYFFIDTTLVRIGAIIISKIIESGDTYAAFCEANSSVLTVIIKFLALAIATACMVPTFLDEKPVIIHKDTPASFYMISICLGAFGATCINVLFALSGLTGSSEAYSEVSSHQFTLPLVYGIILYGLISPLAEEIIFRGIVYNRLYRNYNELFAIIGSPLLFGLYHGNYVQALYGFIMGLMIVLTYERYGAFVHTYLIHAAANIAVYIIMSDAVLRSYIMTPYACAISGALFIVTLILLLSSPKQRSK